MKEHLGNQAGESWSAQGGVGWVPREMQQQLDVIKDFVFPVPAVGETQVPFPTPWTFDFFLR